MFRKHLSIAATLLIAAAAMSQKPHVLMISIDGMKPEYVTHADEHGLKVPNLRSFLKEGTYADGVVGVVPTVTYPSHTTMITGVWPAEHGIVANTLFDPFGEHPGEWYWYFRELKAQTLYQAADAAGLKTASVGWPVTVGAPIDYLIAEFGQSEKTDVPQGDQLKPADIKQQLNVSFAKDADGDDQKAGWAEAIIRKWNPNFVLLHLTDLDHQEHLHSPFSQQANATEEHMDTLVGEVIAAEKTKNPDAKIVVVSDHGFVRVDHEVNLNAYFVQAGLINLKSTKAKGNAQVESWEAQFWLSGGTAAVILKNPGDQATVNKVKAVLEKIKADPANGIDRILDADEVHKRGGWPTASYLIDFKPDYATGSNLKPPLVVDKPSVGTHGYLPDHPELRSTFMALGKGVAHGKDLGVIDMRQIAPTVAEMLGVKLDSARFSPAF